MPNISYRFSKGQTLKSALSVSSAALIFCFSAAAQNCPVSVGDTVDFQSPKKVFERMKRADSPKGEFETTAIYEARLSAIRSGLDLSSPILLEGSYDQRYASYDADFEILRIEEYAWANIHVSWDTALPDGNASGIEAGALDVCGVGLAHDLTPTGTFEAENAYGAKRTIHKSTSVTFGFFDKNGHCGNASWTSAPSIDQRKPAVVLAEIPLSEAPTVKNGMKVGFAILPGAPFAASGKEFKTASMDSPTEQVRITNILVGDTLCAILAAPDGRVFKIVEPDQY